MGMPKMKSRRGAMKRFSLTQSGKIKKSKANKGHLLLKKTKRRKRGLRHGNFVSGPDGKRVKRMLGI